MRLRHGDFDQVTREAGDPAELVRRFAARRPPLLHVVALDAARAGGAPVELARVVQTLQQVQRFARNRLSESVLSTFLV